MRGTVLSRALGPLVALALAIGPAAAGEPAERCAASEDVAAGNTDLPRLAATLKARGTLDVLTVGSATVFGPEATLTAGTVTSQALGTSQAPGTSQPSGGAAPSYAGAELPGPSETAFPFQMAGALRAAMPDLDVRVTVRGGKGMTAAGMLEVLRAELRRERFNLVIWQTGTVEAVRNISPDDFAQTLADGIEAVQDAGAELVLVDPQFSRFLRANANLDPYEAALASAANAQGVVLFRRYDLMRRWAGDGRFDLEHAPRADRRRTVEALHACLGQQLARLLLSAQP